MDESPDNWLLRLEQPKVERDAAIAELREYLLRGLTRALRTRSQANAAFIEDMTQLAIIRVLERKDTFNGRSRFTTWAMSIAVRIAFNELRRREWGNVSLDDLKEPESDGSASPADEAATNDMRLALRQTIAEALTPRQRDVLIAELNGMPQEEIARQLGGTRNSIYKLFHDARKSLRRTLEQKGIVSFDDFVQMNSTQATASK